MYDPLPRLYWREAASGVAHVIDDYGAPGPIVRKPLCDGTDYQRLVDGTAEVPPGAWVEGRDEQLETARFHGPNPMEAIDETLCSACADRYLELLWRRPADYPAIEVQPADGETTYMVTDLHFVTDDELRPCVQLVDELGRTKRLLMRDVETITPHGEMPVVY